MPATEAGDDAAVNRAAARSRRRIDQDRNRWTVEGRVKSRRRIHAPPVRSQRRRPSATAQAVRRGGIPRRRGPERRPQEVQEEEGKGGGGEMTRITICPKVLNGDRPGTAASRGTNYGGPRSSQVAPVRTCCRR